MDLDGGKINSSSLPRRPIPNSTSAVIKGAASGVGEGGSSCAAAFIVSSVIGRDLLRRPGSKARISGPLGRVLQKGLYNFRVSRSSTSDARRFLPLLSSLGRLKDRVGGGPGDGDDVENSSPFEFSGPKGIVRGQEMSILPSQQIGERSVCN